MRASVYTYINDDVFNENNSIYQTGILIHNIIKGIEETMPWPLSPEDITHKEIHVDIPDLMFNLHGLANIITTSSKPVSNGRLPVKSDTERLI